MRLDALATILLVGVTLAAILAAACGTDEEASAPQAPQAAAVPADPAAAGGRRWRLAFYADGRRWRLLLR